MYELICGVCVGLSSGCVVQFLANAEVEFACEYLEFGCKCEKFAADLVNAVDNSDDIMILLSLKKKSKNGLTQVGEPLIRLQYALEHDHKLVSTPGLVEATRPGFPDQADHNLTILWHHTNHTNFLTMILT